MSKYTPGPWIFEPAPYEADRREIKAVSVEGGRRSEALVAEIPKYNTKWEANVRLIAAAPEMLEALKDAHALILEYMPEYPSRDFNSRLNTIYKVIKKAEGA